jgi:hypothetical protein
MLDIVTKSVNMVKKKLLLTELDIILSEHELSRYLELADNGEHMIMKLYLDLSAKALRSDRFNLHILCDDLAAKFPLEIDACREKFFQVRIVICLSIEPV